MTDLMGLYSEILKAAKIDAQLSILCDRAAEYARLHLYARKINGCNGLGEIENLLDEFRKMMYIDDLAIYNLEVTDEDLTKLGAELGEYL
jgi:hypothetical protein